MPKRQIVSFHGKATLGGKTHKKPKLTVSGTVSLSNGLRVITMESDPEKFIQQIRKCMKVKRVGKDDVSRLVTVL